MAQHTSPGEWQYVISKILTTQPTITIDALIQEVKKELPNKALGTIRVRVYAMTKRGANGMLEMVSPTSGPVSSPVQQETAEPEDAEVEQQQIEQTIENKAVETVEEKVDTLAEQRLASPPTSLPPLAAIRPTELETTKTSYMAPYPADAIVYDGNTLGLAGTVWFPRKEVVSSGKTVPWQVNFPDGTVWQIEIPTAKAASSYIPREMMGKNTDISIIQKLFDSNHTFLVIGHTGVGKTTAVVAAAGDKTWKWNMAAKKPWDYPRIYRAVMSNMDYEQLIGQYVPREGKFVWQDGVLTKLVRFGGIFIADEVNFTVPSVLAAMNSLLDNDRTLNIFDHDGEVVHAHPDFRFCATMNPPGYGYSGVKALNDAFKSRFSHILWYGWDRKLEEEVFKGETVYDGIQMFQIHSFFHDLRGMFPSQLHYPPGMRDIEHFVENITLVGFEQAVLSLLLLYNTLEEKQAVLTIVKTNFPNERTAKMLTSSTAEKFG